MAYREKKQHHGAALLRMAIFHGSDDVYVLFIKRHARPPEL